MNLLKTVHRILSTCTLLISLMITVAVAQPKEEVRAVWLTTLYGIDWPKTTSTDIQKQDLIDILDKLQEANFNTIMFQVRARGDLTYYSEIEPYSKYISGILGKDPGYDVLQFAIDEAHKRGMELHAWFVTFNAYNGSTPPPSSTPEHVVNAHPEYIVNYNNQYFWLDPGLPEVRDYLKSIVVEMVDNYDIDGIHFDYIRYPGSDFDDADSYALYGNGQDKNDWRRENINKFVYSVYDYIEANAPNVKVGAAPIGVYKNTSQFTGWQAYYDIYQDSRDWLEKGKADYLCPMIYWDIASNPKFPLVVKDWTDNDFERHIYPGIGTYRMAPGKRNMPDAGFDGMEYMAKYYKRNDWSSDEIIAQIYSSRENNGFGQTYFSSRTITVNYKDIHDKMVEGPYKYPANIPAMTWRDDVPPNVPQNLSIQKYGVSRSVQYLISWDAPQEPADGDAVKYYNVYSGSSPDIDISDIKNVIAFRVENQTQTIISFDTEPTENMYFVVTAYDDEYNESVVSEAVSLDNSLSGLYPQQPANGTTGTETDVRLYWSEPTENEIYGIQVATDNDFQTVVAEYSDISATNYLVERLLPETKYFWRIKTQSSDKWTYAFSFTTKQEALHTEWEASVRENNLPAWFDNTRSIAATSDKLYVLNTDNTIKAYNNQTLEWINDVNTDVYSFNIIKSTSDATLFAATFAVDNSNENFKVAKWVADDNAPEIIIDYQSDESMSLGNAFNVQKSGNKYIITATSVSGGKIIKWIYEDGTVSQPEIIQIDELSSLPENAGIVFYNDMYFTSTNAMGINAIDVNGNVTSVSEGLANNTVLALSTMAFEGRNFLLIMEDRQNTDAVKGPRFKMIDITNGVESLSYKDVYETKVSLGNIPVEIADISVVDEQSNIYVLSAGNGMALYKPTQLAPVAQNVEIRGTLEVGVTITGLFTYSDENNDPQAEALHKWFVADDNTGANGMEISSNNTSELTLNYDHEGKYIAYQVTPMAASGIEQGQTVLSNYYGPVEATTARAPVATNISVSGYTYVNKRLIGSYDYYDENGDAEGASQYQWYRASLADGSDAQPITGAYGKSHLLKSEDVGYYIIFEVTPVSVTSTLSDSLAGKPVKSEPIGKITLTASAVSQIQSSSIRIYPNPAKNKLNIDIRESKITNPVIYVRNTLGQLIITEHAETNSNFSMDVSTLQAGLYLIEITSDNQIVYREKLLVR